MEDPTPFTIPPFTIAGDDWYDLSTMIHRMRRRLKELSKIPKHSGKAPSRIRKANRLKRKKLTGEVKAIESEIVHWASKVVPVEDYDFDLSVEVPAIKDEDDDEELIVD